MNRIGSFLQALRTGTILTAALLCLFTPRMSSAADNASPALLSEIAAGQAAQLAAVDSNANAMALFTSTIGPALGLKDAAGILGARGLSSKVSAELGLPELSQSARELIAALAAWRLAESVYQTGPPTQTVPASPPAHQDWLKATGRLSSLANVLTLLADQSDSESAPGSQHEPKPELLVAAHKLASDAQQRALTTWWSLHEWKERVRQARGLARLCGTWQWTMHNHQNHQEQKMVMLFPPPGYAPANIPLPAETIVLGDSIYIRWERGGYVEEDSLLFVTEGHKKDGAKEKDTVKIEGSFVNNTGGWGPITAKRSAGCQP